MFISLRYFLWLLICPAVFARCSNNREPKITHEIIKKLYSLGEMRPVRCMDEAKRMKVQIPKLPKEEKSRLSVLKVSFQLASDLFMKNASTEWNSSELRQLRDLLGQQREFYKTCSPAASSANDEVKKWSDFWLSLGGFLSKESFSSCAWESARPVILQFMRNFYRSTTKSRRPTRSC